MKKLAVTLSLLAVAAGAFAQGAINMGNNTSTKFRTNAVASPTQGGTAGFALSATGPSYYYELLTAPSTVTSVDASLQALVQAGSVWSDTGLKGTSTGIAGAESTGANTTVGSWAAGAQQSYIIVGWSGNLGTTWATVSALLNGASLDNGVWSGAALQAAAQAAPNNAFIGSTIVGWRQAGGVVGASTIPTPLLFAAVDDAQGTTIKSTTDLFVVGVPEPTSFALVGLGAAALMIFRRRKV